MTTTTNGRAPRDGTLPHQKKAKRGATDALLPLLEDQGYFNVRTINGATCSLMRYMYTVGIVIDIGPLTYARRYCYERHEEAERAFAAYTDITTHPTGPWIKCKGVINGEAIDMLNPALEGNDKWLR